MFPINAVPPITPVSAVSHHRAVSSHDPLARLVPARTHVLTGGPGTGKTSLCLRFIAAGLAAGERAAMLIVGHGSDLKASATRLGLDLDEALRFDRLILLRYHAEFNDRVSQTTRARNVVDELERLLTPMQPSRVVIDSFAPLVVDGPAGGSIVAALSAYLERSGSTSILTYPQDLSGGYDRRLEPLLQNAAAVLRLERRARDRVDLQALTVRAATATDSPVPGAVLPS